MRRRKAQDLSGNPIEKTLTLLDAVPRAPEQPFNISGVLMTLNLLRTMVLAFLLADCKTKVQREFEPPLQTATAGTDHVLS